MDFLNNARVFDPMDKEPKYCTENTVCDLNQELMDQEEEEFYIENVVRRIDDQEPDHQVYGNHEIVKYQFHPQKQEQSTSFAVISNSNNGYNGPCHLEPRKYSNNSNCVSFDINVSPVSFTDLHRTPIPAELSSPIYELIIEFPFFYNGHHYYEDSQELRSTIMHCNRALNTAKTSMARGAYAFTEKENDIRRQLKLNTYEKKPDYALSFDGGILECVSVIFKEEPQNQYEFVVHRRGYDHNVNGNITPLGYDTNGRAVWMIPLRWFVHFVDGNCNPSFAELGPVNTCMKKVILSNQNGSLYCSDWFQWKPTFTSEYTQWLGRAAMFSFNK